MVSNPIQQAVILATKVAPVRGVRRPLALVRTGGVPLLKRTLLVLEREGMRRFVVVFSDPAVVETFRTDAQLAGLDITWVENSERPTEDGFSLLRAAPHVPGEFFLVPCDRVFDPKMIRRLLEEPLEGMTLAATRESAVGREGRTLRMQDRCVVSALTGERDSDAVWTGIATVGRPALGAMEELRDLGGPLTLARLVDVLAREGTVRIADVDKAYWQDLYTDGGRTEAKRQLLGALRKSVDGVIARHINRRFSLAMTALLMHTPVRPNHVTAFSLLVSFAAALTAAYATQASAWWLIVGALLWQLSSMLDGIDGELARLKFAESKMGEWFDTLTDDIGKFVFFLGAGYGASVVTGQSVWLQLCVVGVAVQFTLSLNLYRKLLKTGSGSHYALSWETKPKNTWASRLYHRIEFMSRRDYYVLIWLFLTVIGFVQAGIILMFATTSVVLVHEVLRPRQIRENFALRPPAG